MTRGEEMEERAKIIAEIKELLKDADEHDTWSCFLVAAQSER